MMVLVLQHKIVTLSSSDWGVHNSYDHLN